MISSHRISGKAKTKIRPQMRCSSVRPKKPQIFRGIGREIVLAAPGAELSCLGTEIQKFDILQNGLFGHRSTLSLGVRMGFLRIEGGQVYEKKAPSPEVEMLSTGIPLNKTLQLDHLAARWKDYLYRNTGIRTLNRDNLLDWDPNDNHNWKGGEINHPTDFGGAYPTGLINNWKILGLDSKELLRSNVALNCVYEVAARALANAGFHYSSGNLNLANSFGPDRLGVFLGTGQGPERAHEQIIVDVYSGKELHPMQLPHSLANIPAGYLTEKFRIERRLKTTVSACASSLCAMEDAYRSLQRGETDAALALGYDDAATTCSLLGFNSMKALITNAGLWKSVRSMLAEGILDEKLRSIIERVEAERLPMGNKFNALPKEITELASMPFSKYSAGFVMGLGGGGGLLTTLDKAVELGLPIIGTIAGFADGVPDSSESKKTNIASQGDGLGIAMHYAFEEAKRNYKDFHVDKIGAYIPHGTSTQKGNDSERENVQSALKRYGRDESFPLIFSGDKGWQAHRVAGNYPQPLLHYILKNGIPPVANYRQAGLKLEKGGVFGEAMDRLYPLTAIAGNAGVGQGEHVPFRGNYIGVGAMGFGSFNSFFLLRSFDVEEIPGAKRIEYLKILSERQAVIDATLEQIDFGKLTYYQPKK